MNKQLAAALIAAATVLASCASSGENARAKNPAPCPNIIVLSDASRLIEFDGEAETASNIAYTGEITNVSLGCRYTQTTPIDAEIAIDMAFGRGPKGAAGEKAFKYFVAVTRTDLDVISKTEFLVSAKFEGEKRIVLKEEEINKIFIPRADEGISGTNFEIVVGFALTPEQVIFNRSGKSLKFPDLK